MQMHLNFYWTIESNVRHSPPPKKVHMTNRSQEEITAVWKCDHSESVVSICCITFNHEAYITQALDSFLMQETDFPFEILVHDDASTDNTALIIKEYEKKYPKIIKPIYQKENQHSKGVDVFQFNAQRAKGKYIAICEGDDFWTDPKKLQTQVEFLESHLDYSMCFHAAKIKKDSDLFTQAECEFVQDKEYTARDLLETWLVPTASIVMRKECIFFPLKNKKDIFYSDAFLIFSCLSIGKIRGLSHPMSVYRVNNGSFTHNSVYLKKTLMKLPNNWECFKENFPFVPQRTMNKILAYHYWRRAAIQPTLKKSFQDRKKALKYAPHVAILMPLRPFIIRVIHFLSRFFNEQKMWRSISRITKNM